MHKIESAAGSLYRVICLRLPLISCLCHQEKEKAEKKNEKKRERKKEQKKKNKGERERERKSEREKKEKEKGKILLYHLFSSSVGGLLNVMVKIGGSYFKFELNFFLT